MYALFCAQQNNHSSHCVLISMTRNNVTTSLPASQLMPVDMQVGDILVRHYSCSTDRKITTFLGLETWNHTQTIAMDTDASIRVQDELKWPFCEALHRYRLLADNLKRVDRDWKLDCTKAPLKLQTVRRRMLKELESTDRRVFKDFVQFIDDDNNSGNDKFSVKYDENSEPLQFMLQLD